MIYEKTIKRKVSIEISDTEIANSENNALHFMNTVEIAKSLLYDYGDTNAFIDYIRTKYELEIPDIDYNKSPSLLFYVLAEVTKCLCDNTKKIILSPNIINAFKKYNYTIMESIRENRIESFIESAMPYSQYVLYSIMLNEAICEGKVSLYIPLMKKLSNEIVKAVTVAM